MLGDGSMRRSGCKRATRWLHEKADGGLSRERALALDAHLAGCDACRGREAALAWVSGRLQRGQRPLPHGFWGRLQGRLAQESAEPLARESPVAWRWLPVAATLLLAVGLAVFGLLPRSRNAVPESPSCWS
jgi:anti-sigma factor RsiW